MMATPAISAAINRFDFAAQEFAFKGAAHPDDRDAIEDLYNLRRDQLISTIERAMTKAGPHSTAQ